MLINDSGLFENLVVGIIISLILMCFVFLSTNTIVTRIKENRDVKYRLKNNIKQKKRKKNRVDFRKLVFINIMWITCLIFSLWNNSQYWMDYHVKDYLNVSGVVESITYKGNYRSVGSWIVKIQGQEKTFDLSKKQRELISENEVHTIIYAKRTGMILVVQ